MRQGNFFTPEDLKEHEAARRGDDVSDWCANTRTIVEHDKDFAKVYLGEKRLLLEVLTKGDERLQAQAHNQL